MVDLPADSQSSRDHHRLWTLLGLSKQHRLALVLLRAGRFACAYFRCLVLHPSALHGRLKGRGNDRGDQEEALERGVPRLRLVDVEHPDSDGQQRRQYAGDSRRKSVS